MCTSSYCTEIDPFIYNAAVTHFNLDLSSDIHSINLVDATKFISQVSNLHAEMNGTLQKWSHVIHDVYAGGTLPLEAYSKEFWEDLRGVVEDDGIVSVVSGVWMMRWGLTREEHRWSAGE